jgi:hypothetical protein
MRSLLTSAALGGALLVASSGQTMAPSPGAMSTGGAMSGAHGGMMMMKTPETVTMKAQNGSGENGTATLKDTPKGLIVTIHIKNAKGPQPAHIHEGSCANLNPKPEYPLHNVINGMSVTTVKGVTIGELNGKAAINVHKSLTDIPTYVSCGDIVPHGAM